MNIRPDSTGPNGSRSQYSRPGLVSESAAYLLANGLRLWHSMWPTSDVRSVFDRKYFVSRPGGLRKIFSLTTALILAWICILAWGERYVFATSLASCQWHLWEQWVSPRYAWHMSYTELVLLASPKTLSRITLFFLQTRSLSTLTLILAVHGPSLESPCPLLTSTSAARTVICSSI